MSARVVALLRQLAEYQRDLGRATSPSEAGDYRAEIAAIRHSLWLAGHRPETEDA